MANKDADADAHQYESLLTNVTAALNERQPYLGAFVEHTGGGVLCIEIPLPARGQRLLWGAPDGIWGWELDGEDGDCLGGENIGASETDGIDAVAEAILLVVRPLLSR